LNDFGLDFRALFVCFCVRYFLFVRVTIGAACVLKLTIEIFVKQNNDDMDQILNFLFDIVDKGKLCL
jgi:cytochrome bd-type quinol oxidase subunit 1